MHICAAQALIGQSIAVDSRQSMPRNIELELEFRCVVNGLLLVQMVAMAMRDPAVDRADAELPTTLTRR